MYFPEFHSLRRDQPRAQASNRLSYTFALAFVGMVTAVLLQPIDLSAQNPTGLPRVMPTDVETRMALAAAPEQIREGAGVYLLGEKGFYQARSSKNGFNCLIERDLELTHSIPPERQLFAPQCFDEVGGQSYLRRHLELSRLQRVEGLSGKDASAKIEASKNEYMPSGTGIVYMSSALNHLTDPTNMRGPFLTYVPHVMFLAPNRTNASISGPAAGPVDNFLTGWPFLPGPAQSNGLIIVPLDRELQAKIVEEQADLIQELRGMLPRRETELMHHMGELP